MQLSDSLIAVVEEEFGYRYDEAESTEDLASYSIFSEVEDEEVYSFATFEENSVEVYIHHDRFSEIPAGIYKSVTSDGAGHLTIYLTSLKESKIRAKLIDLWLAAEQFFQENPDAL